MYRIIVEGIDDSVSLEWLMREIKKLGPDITVRYEVIGEVRGGKQQDR